MSSAALLNSELAARRKVSPDNSGLPGGYVGTNARPVHLRTNMNPTKKKLIYGVILLVVVILGFIFMTRTTQVITKTNQEVQVVAPGDGKLVDIAPPVEAPSTPKTEIEIASQVRYVQEEQSQQQQPPEPVSQPTEPVVTEAVAPATPPQPIEPASPDYTRPAPPAPPVGRPELNRQNGLPPNARPNGRHGSRHSDTPLDPNETPQERNQRLRREREERKAEMHKERGDRRNRDRLDREARMAGGVPPPPPTPSTPSTPDKLDIALNAVKSEVPSDRSFELDDPRNPNNRVDAGAPLEAAPVDSTPPIENLNGQQPPPAVTEPVQLRMSDAYQRDDQVGLSEEGANINDNNNNNNNNAAAASEPLPPQVVQLDAHLERLRADGHLTPRLEQDMLEQRERILRQPTSGAPTPLGNNVPVSDRARAGGPVGGRPNGGSRHPRPDPSMSPQERQQWMQEERERRRAERGVDRRQGQGAGGRPYPQQGGRAGPYGHDGAGRPPIPGQQYRPGSQLPRTDLGHQQRVQNRQQEQRRAEEEGSHEL